MKKFSSRSSFSFVLQSGVNIINALLNFACGRHFTLVARKKDRFVKNEMHPKKHLTFGAHLKKSHSVFFEIFGYLILCTRAFNLHVCLCHFGGIAGILVYFIGIVEGRYCVFDRLLDDGRGDLILGFLDG